LALVAKQGIRIQKVDAWPRDKQILISNWQPEAFHQRVIKNVAVASTKYAFGLQMLDGKPFLR